MTQRWTTWRILGRDTRGAEIAETAMVLPLVFMMLMAIFWFGQAFRIYGAITHATREGARAAVAPACATCASTTSATNAQTAVYNALAAAHLDKGNLVPVNSWTRTRPALCVCVANNQNQSCTSTPVACDGTVTDVCVQTNVQISYPIKGGAGACGISVSARYKYPYAFKIPLTTLDLNNMQLPGQAQSRMESQ